MQFYIHISLCYSLGFSHTKYYIASHPISGQFSIVGEIISCTYGGLKISDYCYLYLGSMSKQIKTHMEMKDGKRQKTNIIITVK